MEGTAALRSAAPRWSLAGDQQLLDLLQEIHQRIISKCNDTNKKLEEMSRGLRDASVNLQNVNNKFLALSNTQFVESRVYEDDADVAPPAVEKEPPKPKDLASDLTKLKESLQVLESYHEQLLIVRDSDSDSDSDENDDRLVLKPKDLYADRPLPYIIGSQAWKTKWHAGLVPDESDSDSSTSKVEEVEQYSESEEETQEHYMPDRTMSPSELSLQSDAPVSVSPVHPSPAAVAADLARRLGGDIKIPEREPLYTQPETVPRKLYKPQEPLATTIFPDEPPPLDDQSSDDDIFAELHKTQPKAHNNRVDDLFDFRAKPSGLEEALFGAPKVQTNQNADNPPLLPEDSEPVIQETTKAVPKEKPEENVKKPVGGISLFGTNKHAESIGAAILQRNRRKSSTSGDESNTEEVQVPKESPVKEVKKERDIFDDLFAKSERLNKKNAKPEVKPVIKPREEVKPKEVKKKDIFSDIFDDIDDIFSSDIVTVQVKPTANNDKALFSEEDDLFAEVSTDKKEGKKDTEIVSGKNNLPGAIPKETKLFAEVTNIVKSDVKKETKVIKEIKETKSIFDSDSDDGLFTSVAKNVKQNTNKEVKPVENKLKDDDDNDELFTKKPTGPKIDVAKNIGKATEVSEKALFDSDDELFKDTKINTEAKPLHTLESRVAENKVLTTPIDRKPEKQSDQPTFIRSVNIESSEFIDSQEISKHSSQPSVSESIDNDIVNDMPPLESHMESTTEGSHDSFDDDDSYTVESTVVKNNTHKNDDFSQDSQNKNSNDQISNNRFNILNKETHFKENILRTTRIASDEEKIPEKIQPQYVLNDSDDDLFRSKPKIPTKPENYKQNEQPKKIEPPNPSLFSSPPDGSDVFSDIFDDVPPAFEKPKEPKKSKNVNALFDDDSDDEALFFKKSDVITDEKPDISPSEERFGIFNDEPPAIDVDFIQKPSRTEDPTKTSLKSEDVSPTLDKTDSVTKPVQAEKIISKPVKETEDVLNREAQDTTDNTAKETKKIGKLKPMNININVNSLLPGASPKKKQVENADIKQEHTASNEELHKPDKIEPKIVKSISFDDPEILDNKISKERAKIQVKRRPSTRRARKEAARVSAIDFTDSSIDSSNDNSSKDEVKKKVVKTVYILNDDDIFGSTTNDTNIEPTKKHLNIVDSDEELFKKPTQKTTDSVTTDKNELIEQPRIENKSSFDLNDSDDLFSKPSHTKYTANDEVDIAVRKLFKNEDKTESNEHVVNINVDGIKKESVSKKSQSKSFLDSDDSDDLFRPTNRKSSTGNTVNDPKHDSDEELFDNAPKTKINTEKFKEPSLFSKSDDDDLFQPKTKEISRPIKTLRSYEEDILNNKGIGILGKVYNKAEVVKETHNIFDDFPSKSDIDKNTSEETKSKTVLKEPIVETAVKNVEKSAKKSILDDLSDEDDLFKSKTKLMSKKDKSLFGDDGDDDDLFGTKPVKEVKPDVPVALPVKEPKAAEPVFVDPLSLFGDDD